jgi:hypothetical protein
MGIHQRGTISGYKRNRKMVFPRLAMHNGKIIGS